MQYLMKYTQGEKMYADVVVAPTDHAADSVAWRMVRDIPWASSPEEDRGDLDIIAVDDVPF